MSEHSDRSVEETAATWGDQIYKTFAATGAVTEPESQVRAQSGEHLQQLLQEDHRIHEPGAPFDLGSTDFDALRRKFEEGHKNIAANRLRGQLNSKLQRMVRLNQTRMDLLEELRQMIDDYNAGRDGVELFFEKLLALASDLSDEERRGMRENLSEEELALFDILLKPRPGLTAEDEKAVKQAARALLDMLKSERLMLDWRKQQKTRAKVVRGGVKSERSARKTGSRWAID